MIALLWQHLQENGRTYKSLEMNREACFPFEKDEMKERGSVWSYLQEDPILCLREEGTGRATDDEWASSHWSGEDAPPAGETVENNKDCFIKDHQLRKWGQRQIPGKGGP